VKRRTVNVVEHLAACGVLQAKFCAQYNRAAANLDANGTRSMPGYCYPGGNIILATMSFSVHAHTHTYLCTDLRVEAAGASASIPVQLIPYDLHGVISAQTHKALGRGIKS